MLEDPNIRLHFSVIVTQKCPLRCTYCHFFHTSGRTRHPKDISPELFETYMHFIHRLSAKALGKVSFRFSGGEPLALGDKLFEFSNQAYAITGTKPYILTSGKGLNQSWIDKAKKAHIDHLLVSMENPLDPDPGSTDPYETIEKIKDFSTEDLPLYPGVMIVRNNGFKDIYKICRIVYDQLGLLPNIQELNYQPYESPTDQELQQLYENLRMVVTEFWNKAALNFFVYVSPEFAAVHENHETFLLELGIDNPHQIRGSDLDRFIQPVLDQIKVNHPESGCERADCDWYTGCRRVKWLWKVPSYHVSAAQKSLDYCRFKQTINAAFYDALFPSRTIREFVYARSVSTLVL